MGLVVCNLGGELEPRLDLLHLWLGCLERARRRAVEEQRQPALAACPRGGAREGVGSIGLVPEGQG